MQIDDSTVWSGALAVIGAIGTGVKMIFTRIARLEQNTISRSEFDALERDTVHRDEFASHVERSEASRKELRDSVVSVFDKLDELKTILLQQRGH